MGKGVNLQALPKSYDIAMNPVLFLQNAGGAAHCVDCDMPSLPSHQACTQVRDIYDSSNDAKRDESSSSRMLLSPSPLTFEERPIIYLNMGALHLMHLTPARPWVLSHADHPPEGKHGGDFYGWLFLEDWLRAELECLSKLASSIVIMTPHFVCDAKFIGRYRC